MLEMKPLYNDVVEGGKVTAGECSTVADGKQDITRGDSVTAGEQEALGERNLLLRGLSLIGGWFAAVLTYIRNLRLRKMPHPDPEIRHLENQEELIKWLRIQARLLTPLHSFYRGIAIGLGVMIGTGLVLSIIVHLLSQLALAPLVGDFAKQIMEYLETATNGS